MKTNKILLGGIAGGISFFMLGWIIYGMLLMDFMASNSNQCAARPMQDMIWWAMILSNLALGFLLSIVFTWANTKGVIAGAKVAGILGLLFGISIDFSFYSMTTMYHNIMILFVDIVAYTLMTAIAGAVIAWVMGMGKKAA